MINTKETMEETLVEYGVAFTDALSDRLLGEIYYECEEYLSEFKDEFFRVLMTDDNGDYIEDLWGVSIRDIREAFSIAEMEINKKYNKWA